MSASALDSILGQLAGTAETYLGSGIAVSVKTNYSPAITVYNGAAGGSGGQPGQAGGGGLGAGLSRLIGLQVGVQVRDAQSGHVIATYGPDGGAPPTNYLRVVLGLAVVGVLGLAVVKLIRAV